jgi:hypothetical protein
MPEGWSWDETLYAGSAGHYQRGRIPYAVGVDPDPGMLAEAERRTAATGQHHVRWVRERAEELSAELGIFRVATFGQSFHWMDRDTVAKAVRRLLSADGAFVQVSDVKNDSGGGDGSLPHPAPPYPAMRALVRRYLGPVRRAGAGVLPQRTPSDEAEVLARNGYRGPERVVAPAGDVLVRKSDDLVDWVYSRSDSTPHLLGERRVAFEADLRQLLRETSPTGRFAERRPDTETTPPARFAARHDSQVEQSVTGSVTPPDGVTLRRTIHKGEAVPFPADDHRGQAFLPSFLG